MQGQTSISVAERSSSNPERLSVISRSASLMTMCLRKTSISSSTSTTHATRERARLQVIDSCHRLPHTQALREGGAHRALSVAAKTNCSRKFYLTLSPTLSFHKITAWKFGYFKRFGLFTIFLLLRTRRNTMQIFIVR